MVREIFFADSSVRGEEVTSTCSPLCTVKSRKYCGVYDSEFLLTVQWNVVLSLRDLSGKASMEGKVVSNFPSKTRNWEYVDSL